MKIAKQAYTTEFKELAVKWVKDGQSIRTVIKEPAGTVHGLNKGVERRTAGR